MTDLRSEGVAPLLADLCERLSYTPTAVEVSGLKTITPMELRHFMEAGAKGFSDALTLDKALYFVRLKAQGQGGRFNFVDPLPPEEQRLSSNMPERKTSGWSGNPSFSSTPGTSIASSTQSIAPPHLPKYTAPAPAGREGGGDDNGALLGDRRTFAQTIDVAIQAGNASYSINVSNRGKESCLLRLCFRVDEAERLQAKLEKYVPRAGAGALTHAALTHAASLSSGSSGPKAASAAFECEGEQVLEFNLEAGKRNQLVGRIEGTAPGGAPGGIPPYRLLIYQRFGGKGFQPATQTAGDGIVIAQGSGRDHLGPPQQQDQEQALQSLRAALSASSAPTPQQQETPRQKETPRQQQQQHEEHTLMPQGSLSKNGDARYLNEFVSLSIAADGDKYFFELENRSDECGWLVDLDLSANSAALFSGSPLSPEDEFDAKKGVLTILLRPFKKGMGGRKRVIELLAAGLEAQIVYTSDCKRKPYSYFF